MRRCVNLFVCLAMVSGYSLTTALDLPRMSASTVFTQYHHVPNERKERAIKVLLDYLRQTSDEQYFAGFPDMEQRTKIVSNHRMAFRAGTGTPKVVLVDLSLGYSPYSDIHLIAWKMNTWQYQEIPAFPKTFQAMQARVSVSRDGVPEVGAFYDSSRGSGSLVPIFVLLQLRYQRWKIVWKTPDLPRTMDHGDAWFIGSGISRVALEYDSWLSKDPREHIFSECHPCLHRRYLYIWKRAGNSKYAMESFGPIESPYNTVTEFIYLLTAGKNAEAGQYVTDPALVQKAVAMGLRKEPNTPGWFIDSADRERGPYRITSGPAMGTEITFSLRRNKVLISDLQKG